LTVFKDDGAGATDISLRYWRHIRPRLGRIIRADAGLEPLVKEPRMSRGIPYIAEYNLILLDDRGNEVRLSGCNCGYGGTGPHGTFEILKAVGLLPDDVDFNESGIPDQRRATWRRGECFSANLPRS
jgi:hypothetical protein